MQTDTGRAEIDQIIRKIIGCAYTVSNTLGSGFLEKVYENALVYEIRQHGLVVTQQHPISMYYGDVVVGEYMADMFVEQQVIVELKAVQALDTVHMAQCMNYLRATGMRVCLLLNFGKPRVEVKRIVRDF